MFSLCDNIAKYFHKGFRFPPFTQMPPPSQARIYVLIFSLVTEIEKSPSLLFDKVQQV